MQKDQANGIHGGESYARGEQKVGRPNAKAAHRLAVRQADYDKTVAGKSGYTRPGSTKK